MKKLIEEDENEGLEKFLGEVVIVFCVNYIYTGKLVGVNSSCILLEDAAIVYETGDLSTKTWKDAQKLPKPRYIMLSSIESFGVLK